MVKNMEKKIAVKNNNNRAYCTLCDHLLLLKVFPEAQMQLISCCLNKWRVVLFQRGFHYFACKKLLVRTCKHGPFYSVSTSSFKRFSDEDICTNHFTDTAHSRVIKVVKKSPCNPETESAEDKDNCSHRRADSAAEHHLQWEGGLLFVVPRSKYMSVEPPCIQSQQQESKVIRVPRRGFYYHSET